MISFKCSVEERTRFSIALTSTLALLDSFMCTPFFKPFCKEVIESGIPGILFNFLSSSCLFCFSCPFLKVLDRRKAEILKIEVYGFR
jgi:hypothetical protein